MIETLAPPNPETEELAAIGCMMVDKDALAHALETLRAEDFYSPRNGQIFQVAADLYARNEPVDVTTVCSELKNQNELAKVGGAEYIFGALNSIPTAAHVDFYCKRVRDYAVLRELATNCARIGKACYEHEDEPREILERAETAIFAIAERGTAQTLMPISEMSHEFMEELERIYRGQKKILGLETGFPQLDRLLSGLQPGNMVTLAARPGMGKTSMAIDFARHAAVVKGIPVAFFSLEMSKTEIQMRLVSSMTGINLYNVRNGMIGTGKWPDILKAIEAASAAPLYLDCSSLNMSSMSIRASSRRLAGKLARAGKRLGLIVVDYLQLISTSSSKYKSRESEVAEISRSLKALSMDLSVPVLALSQLNRKTEETGREGRPRLSDLRESGSIEQDSDVVMFIYREAIYRANATDEEKSRTKLIVAKHRNGAQGEVDFHFAKEITRFYESAKEESEA